MPFLITWTKHPIKIDYLGLNIPCCFCHPVKTYHAISDTLDKTSHAKSATPDKTSHFLGYFLVKHLGTSYFLGKPQQCSCYYNMFMKCICIDDDIFCILSLEYLFVRGNHLKGIDPAETTNFNGHSWTQTIGTYWSTFLSKTWDLHKNSHFEESQSGLINCTYLHLKVLAVNTLR